MKQKKLTWAFLSADGLMAILMIEGLSLCESAFFKASLIWSVVSQWYPLKFSNADASLSYLILAVRDIGGKLKWIKLKKQKSNYIKYSLVILNENLLKARVSVSFKALKWTLI